MGVKGRDILQQQVSRLLRSISSIRPITPDRLHHHMEFVLEKRIVIAPAPPGIVLTGVCGLWMTVEGEDFERVYYAKTESEVHRQQFINHEFGHMILGHAKQSVSFEQISLLAPLVPANAIVHALSRSSFTDEQEALAEVIGDKLALMMLEDSRGLDTGFGRVL
jgi:xanthosine utilization system XapX-like protein